MVIIFKKDVFKPKAYMNVSFTKSLSVKQTFSNVKWFESIKTKFHALIKNKAWVLVLPPFNRTIIGSKQVFHVKKLSPSLLDKRKSRVVVQGHKQVPSFDFSKNFSPIIKQVKIHRILTLALSNGWKLHQWDINNAFLNETLQEEVYMQHPKRFE